MKYLSIGVKMSTFTRFRDGGLICWMVECPIVSFVGIYRYDAKSTLSYAYAISFSSTLSSTECQ